MGGDDGEVLERVDRLLAPLGVPRPQRGSEDLLEQGGLAICRGPERTQVAAADAVASQLGDRTDDLALGLVVVLDPGAELALDHAVFFELLDEARLGPGLLEDVLYREERSAVAHADAGPWRAPATGAAAARRGGVRGLDRIVRRGAGGQLLADDPQRQELVALEAQDRAEPGDVGGAVEPVAAGRPPRRQQLLVLQIADLGDRDVREFLPQRLADRADGQRLLPGLGRLAGLRAGAVGGGGGVLGHQRSRKVSLYLPIWSSSPSLRRCDSMRRRLT